MSLGWGEIHRRLNVLPKDFYNIYNYGEICPLKNWNHTPKLDFMLDISWWVV